LNPNIHNRSVITVASADTRAMMDQYATMIIDDPCAQIYPIQFEELSTDSPWLTVAKRAGLVVSEWHPDPLHMQRMLRSFHEWNLPAVFIRPGRMRPGGRLMVATNGGPNVCEQMWIAQKISSGTNRPIHFLRWENGAARNHSAGEQMISHLLGIDADIRKFSGADFLSGIPQVLDENDVLMMGAPSSLRWSADFDDSLPDQVAKAVENPLFLLSSPSARQVKLRNVFWGGLIRPQLKARGKTEALEQLVDTLIYHNQLSAGQRADIIHSALVREKMQSTAVEHQTAFPHVMLPGRFEVSGCVGIFPEGVPFDDSAGALSNFIFLLITPAGFSDEYLTVLAKIARRMLLPNVRKALLKSRTPAQALNILEPCRNAGNGPADLSLKTRHQRAILPV
jgi:mannitol/fructose-specific phosphotransferase system IIA component (Ntr-type)